MLLGYALDATYTDKDVLQYHIDIAIRAVMDQKRIQIIDKNTRSKIVQTCLENRHCKSGKYTLDYLQMLIRKELFEGKI